MDKDIPLTQSNSSSVMVQRSNSSWSPIQKHRRRSLQEVAQRNLLNKFKLQPNEETLIKRRLSTPVPTLEECLGELNFSKSREQFLMDEEANLRKRRKSLDCIKIEQAIAPQGDRNDTAGSISPGSGDSISPNSSLPYIDFTTSANNSPRAKVDENMLNKLTSRFFEFQLQQ